jgi:hypothetical protein
MSENAKIFRLSHVEWKQVEYLIQLTKQFCFFTNSMGRTKGTTVGHVYEVYNSLFTCLEKQLASLEVKQARESKNWINPLIDGLTKALEKLRKYYQQTYTDLGSVYALGTILTPAYKLALFQEEASFPGETNWEAIYKQQFYEAYNIKYASRECLKSNNQYQQSRQQDDLSIRLQLNKTKNILQSDNAEDEYSESEQYLYQRKFYSNFYSNLY